jgi:hypothetical protein
MHAKKFMDCIVPRGIEDCHTRLEIDDYHGKKTVRGTTGLGMFAKNLRRPLESNLKFPNPPSHTIQ